MMEKHISVLLNESISSLNLKENSIIVDATLGYGGHSSSILDRIKKGYLFAFDQDSEAIRHSTDRLLKVGTNFTIIKSNFVNIRAEFYKRNIKRKDITYDDQTSKTNYINNTRCFVDVEHGCSFVKMLKSKELTNKILIFIYFCRLRRHPLRRFCDLPKNRFRGCKLLVKLP